mgnify:CR=1 FL=1
MQNVKKETETSNLAPTEKISFYADVEYNKSRRVRYIVLLVLLFLVMGLMIGTFVASKQWMFVIVLGAVLLIMASLIPTVLKNYPVKSDAVLTLVGREVFVQGKTLRTTDIEKVIVNVEVGAVSKNKDENKEFLKQVASAFPEEKLLGTVDLVLKSGPKVKKGETIYMTLSDSIGAVVALVNAGVKHYAIGFSLKKFYEPAAFSITKTEKQKAKLTDVSAKERRRQII